MKKIYLFIIGIFTLLIFPKSVFASGGSISVTASSNNVKVGDTVNITVTFRADSGIGGYMMELAPTNTSVLSPNGGMSLNGLVDGNPSSNSHTISFKAINTGSCTFRVNVRSNGEFVDAAGNDVQYSFSAVTVNVSEATYQDIKSRPSSGGKKNNISGNSSSNKELSSNNFLKSININGLELTPAFDKEHLEYSAVYNELVEKVNVSVEQEDDTAVVEGVGEIPVSDGENKLEIKVTAENGDVRTYIIHLEIKDSKAINVKINNKKYIVVKNKSLLPDIEGFESTTIKINDIDVPAFVNKLSKLVLVGLKDSKGNISLAVYKDNKYTLYKNIESSKLNILVLDTNKVLSGFKKTKLTINKVIYNAFQLKKSKNVIIVYGMNVDTGEVGYYQYDKANNTFIEFDDSLLKNIDTYKLISIASISAAIFMLVINITVSIIRRKKRKNRNKKKNILDE